ncbi:hypothetical protein MTBGP_06910 [Moorella thermoacetica]|uniref:hypothetical protein n=1 Tax=Neomoorella thermoacetica TaxID=1525 RepID=UPI0030CD3683
MLKESLLLAYPDPITNPSMITGAVFLYFNQPIAVTLPPMVITQESYELLNLVTKRKPDWGTSFLNFFRGWRYQQNSFDKVIQLFKPLQEEKRLIVAWNSYPAGIESLEKAKNLLEHYGFEEIFQSINPLTGCGEIIRHIMLERFLELNQDLNALFDYCGELFAGASEDRLLVEGYLLRLPMLYALGKSTPLLLTNERIWNLLCTSNDVTAEDDTKLEEDVFAWEVFRQIVSPVLDPLDSKKIELILHLLKTRQEQIERLKIKCLSISQRATQPDNILSLPSQIQRLLKMEAQKEIADLLELDRNALEDFFVTLFSDEKTWLALLTFIAGVINGQLTITTGGLLGTLASVGAKTVQVASKRKNKIKRSDFALVYSIKRLSAGPN